MSRKPPSVDEAPTPRESSGALNAAPVRAQVAALLADELAELELERMRPGPDMDIQAALNLHRGAAAAAEFATEFRSWATHETTVAHRAKTTDRWVAFQRVAAALKRRRGAGP